MFKFLKEKLKSAVSVFTKKIEEEGKEEIVEETVKEAKKKETKATKKETTTKKTKETEKKETKETKKTVKEKKSKKEPAVKEEISEETEEEVVSETEEAEPIKEKATAQTIEATEVYTEEEPVTDVETEEKVEELKVEAKEAKPGFFKRWFGKKETEEAAEVSKELAEKKTKPALDHLDEGRSGERKSEDKRKEETKAPKEEKTTETEPQGFFERVKQKIVAKEITQTQFDELFWELEVGLLENNVALEVIEKIKGDLQEELVGKPIKRTAIPETIEATLKKSVEGLFVESPDVLALIKGKKPYIICFVGINGSGKTTTIAKFAKLLQNEGLSVVLAAADTFRAAAIDQLQTHADNLSVKLIKHDYGSDPAAVAFDAVKHAEAKKIDVVLIDTAGRMHSNVNLVDEMKKIIRVAKPDLKVFIGESITGNDCIEQAKVFDEAIGIDGVILSKADVDEKGGAALSVSYVTGKPILFLGTGQRYEDLKPFAVREVMKNLGLEKK